MKLTLNLDSSRQKWPILEQNPFQETIKLDMDELYLFKLDKDDLIKNPMDKDDLYLLK